MVSKFHDTLAGLIRRAREIEDALAGGGYCEGKPAIDRLEELRTRRLQAEEVMRSADYGGERSSVDFCSLVHQVASDLKYEVEQCDKKCAPSARR